MIEYSEIQLDALRELANIGSGTAATALSSLLGKSIDLRVPTAEALPLAEALEAVGAVDQPVTGVVLPVFGDMDGVVLLLFTPEHVEALYRLLGVEPDSEVGVSALGEIANILGSSYTGALGRMTGLELEPRPPQTVRDLLGAIVSSVVATNASASDIALFLDSNLVVEDEDCAFSFMLVPSPEGVAELLGRLGLA